MPRRVSNKEMWRRSRKFMDIWISLFLLGFVLVIVGGPTWLATDSKGIATVLSGLASILGIGFLVGSFVCFFLSFKWESRAKGL